MYRILRANKNRFGSTAELGIFEMLQNGLREVTNPSELLLSQNHEGLSGVAIASAIEGIRPFLIEAQALVSTAAYGTPQRSSTGFDIRRMNMLKYWSLISAEAQSGNSALILFTRWSTSFFRFSKRSRSWSRMMYVNVDFSTFPSMFGNPDSHS